MVWPMVKVSLLSPRRGVIQSMEGSREVEAEARKRVRRQIVSLIVPFGSLGDLIDKILNGGVVYVKEMTAAASDRR